MLSDFIDVIAHTLYAGPSLEFINNHYFITH